MTFRGWTYTLEHYASALARCGFAIEAIREPKPDPSGTRYQRWARIPLFMTFRAVKARPSNTAVEAGKGYGTR
jgi:hypothetical protein